MLETTRLQYTFQNLVSTMVSLREEGGSEIIKRANFLDFHQINEGVEFEQGGVFFCPSFGYMERLMRKLAQQFEQTNFSLLKIKSYREACGYFGGELALYLDDKAQDSCEEIQFEWEGKGQIEDTWDCFTQWQTQTKKI